MTATAIAHLLAGIRSRRALLSSGLAALGLAVDLGDEWETAEAAPNNRQRHRKRQRRRKRRGGGRPGDPPPPCVVCEDLDDRPSCRFTSIQAAINAQAWGPEGRMSVCPGTYKEPLLFNRILEVDTIEIIGAGVQNTTIDANGDGPAITVTRASEFPEIVIADFLITGGKASAGGGVFNQGNLQLEDCEVTKNESEGAPGGGGIYNEGGLTLQNTTVFNNEAEDGEGGGIFNASGGTVSLELDSRVFGNEPNNCVGTTACGA